MKQVTSVGKSTLNLYRAYWRWVNRIVDKCQIPEEKLHEMVRKGYFKTSEEAEQSAKKSLKISLVAVPVAFISILAWSIAPKPDNQPDTVQVQEHLAPTQPSSVDQNSLSTQATEQESSNAFNPALASIPASVMRTSSDLSYETTGSIQENEKVVVLDYLYTKECGLETPGAIFQQEWKFTFDLTFKTWTSKVQEISNCLGNSRHGWRDSNKTPNPFTIETIGSETILKADTLDDDGSLLTKDALITRYAKAFSSSAHSHSSTSHAISDSQSPTRLIQAGEGFANLRSQPTTEVDVVTKLPNGTPVVILNEQTNSSGQRWYQIEVNGQVGWIYSELIN